MILIVNNPACREHGWFINSYDCQACEHGWSDEADNRHQPEECPECGHECLPSRSEKDEDDE